VSEIIYKKDVEKGMSEKEQLDFYRGQFEYSHCSNCGNELGWDWVVYEGIRHCERCFDLIREKEIEDAKKTIEECERKSKELKEKYNLGNEEE